MKMEFLTKSAAAMSLMLLAGCGGSTWETTYSDTIAPSDSRGWRVVSVDVQVPETLSVSEENSYAPDADIVWRGEVIGDRYEQVDRIVTEAARAGVAPLRGGKRVKLLVQVQTFHALSDKARSQLTQSGVHNITMLASVVDASSGAVIVAPETIQADLVAYVGETAKAAEAKGLTQRVRISNHLRKVFAGWIGAGPDEARGSFERFGR